jgi:hypothetical protein
MAGFWMQNRHIFEHIPSWPPLADLCKTFPIYGCSTWPADKLADLLKDQLFMHPSLFWYMQVCLTLQRLKAELRYEFLLLPANQVMVFHRKRWSFYLLARENKNCSFWCVHGWDLFQAILLESLSYRLWHTLVLFAIVLIAPTLIQPSCDKNKK